MANKYDVLFTDNLSSKQVDRLYDVLLDEIEIGSEDHKLLKEASDKAYAAAFRRESEQAKRIQEERKTDTLDCIICW